MQAAYQEIAYRRNVRRHRAISQRKHCQWEKRTSRAHKDGTTRGLFGGRSNDVPGLRRPRPLVTQSARYSGLDSPPDRWLRQRRCQEHWRAHPLDVEHEKAKRVIALSKYKRYCTADTLFQPLHLEMGDSYLFDAGMTVDAVKAAEEVRWDYISAMYGMMEEEAEIRQHTEHAEELANLDQEATITQSRQEQNLKETAALEEALKLLQDEIAQEEERERNHEMQQQQEQTASPTRSQQDIMDLIAEAERLAQEGCASVPCSPTATQLLTSPPEHTQS